MLELKVQDLRLRGRGLTLFQAAEENGVKADLMDSLIYAIYSRLQLYSDDYDSQEGIKEENPNILDTLSEEEFKKGLLFSEHSIQDLLDNGLITQDGNNFVLTQKSVTILKRAAEIQKQVG